MTEEIPAHTLLLDLPTLKTLLAGFSVRVPQSRDQLETYRRVPGNPLTSTARTLLQARKKTIFPLPELFESRQNLGRLNFIEATAAFQFAAQHHRQLRTDWLCLITSHLLDYLEGLSPLPASPEAIAESPTPFHDLFRNYVGSNVAAFLEASPDFRLAQSNEGDFTLEAIVQADPELPLFELQDRHGRPLSGVQKAQRQKDRLHGYPEALTAFQEAYAERPPQLLSVHWAASALLATLKSRKEESYDYATHLVFDDPERRRCQAIAATKLPGNPEQLATLARKRDHPLGMHLHPLLSLPSLKPFFPFERYLEGLPPRTSGTLPKDLDNLQYESVLVLEAHLQEIRVAAWLLAIDRTLRQALENPRKTTALNHPGLAGDARKAGRPDDARLISQGPPFSITADPAGGFHLHTLNLRDNPAHGPWPFTQASAHDKPAFVVTISWQTVPSGPGRS